MEFWAIYDEYFPQVRRFILSRVKEEWVADDLVQETFVRVQANLSGLKDHAKLSSWLFKIAHNLCQDHFRESRRAEIYDNTRVESVGFEEPLYAQMAMEQKEMGQCVQARALQLPDSLRLVLLMYDGMGFDHREIADILEISVATAKTRLHRARKKMREILEEQCDFEMDERNVLTCVPRGTAF